MYDIFLLATKFEYEFYYKKADAEKFGLENDGAFIIFA